MFVGAKCKFEMTRNLLMHDFQMNSGCKLCVLSTLFSGNDWSLADVK